MAESIIAWFIATGAVLYGLAMLIIAIGKAEEEKRRAGELAWQQEGL